MTERTLHLVSVYALQIGWILFGLIFIFRKRWSRDKTRKRDPMSILGIVVQTSALFAVWMFPRRSHTVPPLGYWFSTHHRDSGSRACNHLRVDNVVGAARAGKAVEPAGARARRSQTGSRRTVSFCAASDLQRHSWNDRGRWTRMDSLDRINDCARAFWSWHRDPRAKRRKTSARAVRCRV